MTTRGQLEQDAQLPERLAAEGVCDSLISQGRLKQATFVGYYARNGDKFPTPPNHNLFFVRYIFKFQTQAGLIREFPLGYIAMERSQGKCVPVAINTDGFGEKALR